MSNDKREDIIARLFIIAQSVTGVTTTVRNRALMQNEQRPAQVLLDGDEVPVLTSQTQRLKAMQSLMWPQLMELRPQLFYLPQEKRVKNIGIGQEANAWRIQFLEKLWGSVELAELIGSNGSIVYNGCETDLKSGSAMSGEIRLDFIVTYFLQPTA
jgi:hypothetical protein